MRYNGLFIVLEMALRHDNNPFIQRYRDPLILGSLREDVWYIPGLNTVFEHWSFSHFYKPPLPGGYLPLLWPGPRMKAEKFYRRSLTEHKSGNQTASFIQLGRVAHLLTDMCCPVHVHRTVHDTDPFEWYVEGNRKKLLQLPLPQIPNAKSPSQLIHDLSIYTSNFRGDPTNHYLGRVLKRLKILQSVTIREAAEQAEKLIPMAASYTVALFRLYLADIQQEISKQPTTISP